MGNIRFSRHGSMQYWPRKRARSEIPRVRVRVFTNDSKVDGFYGYKVGMSQATFKDSGNNSMTKGQTIIKPITIVECPPLKVAGVRFYKMVNFCLTPSSDVFADKLDKELSRSMIVPKAKEIKATDFDDVRLIVYTIPKLTSLPKKKPEVFELAIRGTKEEKLAYAQEKMGKELIVTDVFKLNELIDIHSVTKGKGFQGPVKRFGVHIRQHKAEKTKRGPASLGAWRAQGHMMYRVAHAGQMGYHLRTEYNKPIVMMGDDVSKVNPIDGFSRYGIVRCPYIVLVGSIPGNKMRLIRMTHAYRPNPKKKTDALKISKINTESKQGN